MARRPKLSDPAPDSPTDPGTGRPLFTIERQILAYVRAGAYPHVAAQAVGVPASSWDVWTNPRKVNFRAFQNKLKQAAAQARVRAEVALFTDKPTIWLRNGPGKEQPDNPGWSGLTKPVLSSSVQVNILASPEWNGLWATILNSLANFPEARAALAEALAGMEGHIPARRGRPPKAIAPEPPTTIDVFPTDSPQTPPPSSDDTANWPECPPRTEPPWSPDGNP